MYNILALIVKKTREKARQIGATPPLSGRRKTGCCGECRGCGQVDEPWMVVTSPSAAHVGSSTCPQPLGERAVGFSRVREALAARSPHSPQHRRRFLYFR